MKQKENESRADYLVRVVHEFMNTTCAGSETLHYDEADCDGLCLADDIESEVAFLKQQRDELLTALRYVLGETDDEKIGWRGTLHTDKDIFSCEFCSKTHEDCTLIAHLDDCPITIARTAITNATA